jgi:hypothetical protein
MGSGSQEKIFLPEVYDLGMIIALSFRINSPHAKEFRKWIIEKTVRKTNKSNDYISDE